MSFGPFAVCALPGALLAAVLTLAGCCSASPVALPALRLPVAGLSVRLSAAGFAATVRLMGSLVSSEGVVFCAVVGAASANVT